MFNVHVIITNTKVHLFNLQGHENLLTDDIIGELARNISTKNLIVIAVEHLGVHMNDIYNMEHSCSGDTWELKCDILKDGEILTLTMTSK